MVRRTVEAPKFLETIQELNRQKKFTEVVSSFGAVGRLEFEGSSIICRGQVHFEIGYAYYWIGDYAKAHSRVRAALKIASLARRIDLVGSYKNLNGLILQNLGRVSDSIEEFNESYVLRKNSLQNSEIYGSLVNLSLALFLKGEISSAIARIGLAKVYAEKFNSEAEVGLCERNLVLYLIISGEFTQAAEI